MVNYVIAGVFVLCDLKVAFFSAPGWQQFFLALIKVLFCVVSRKVFTVQNIHGL